MSIFPACIWATGVTERTVLFQPYGLKNLQPVGVQYTNKISIRCTNTHRNARDTYGLCWEPHQVWNVAYKQTMVVLVEWQLKLGKILFEYRQTLFDYASGMSTKYTGISKPLHLVY